MIGFAVGKPQTSAFRRESGLSKTGFAVTAAQRRHLPAGTQYLLSH